VRVGCTGSGQGAQGGEQGWEWGKSRFKNQTMQVHNTGLAAKIGWDDSATELSQVCQLLVKLAAKGSRHQPGILSDGQPK
jgi:hypothetical protein